jgi:3-methyladenine DNA glycosylase/8-oxoguanine DNA glycosylase
MRALLTEPVSFAIPVKEPFNFALYSSVFSLGEYKLPFAYGSATWRTIIETNTGKMLPVEVSPDSPNRSKTMLVKVFRDTGREEKQLIRNTISDVFCSEFALRGNNRVFQNGFGDIFRRYYGLKPHLSQDPYQALVKIIIRQQIGAEYAKRAITNVTERFGTKVTVGGVDFFAFPNAKRLSQTSKRELLATGIGYKWRYIRRLSKEVVDGDLDFDYLRRLNEDKVVEELEERVGIGAWSSRVFLFDGLHRLDTYPIFDITVQRALLSLRGHDASTVSYVDMGWEDFGPQTLAGFYATYLFAYFREMVRVDQQFKRRWKVHRF